MSYLMALTQPSLVRLPRTIGGTGVHTQPVSVKGSFEFFVGTAGFGIIAIHPRLVNDRDSFTYSNATFVGNGIWGLAVVAAGSTNYTGEKAKLPYTYANWTANTGADNLSGRLVSCGVEVRYAGTLVDRSGTIISISDPACRDLNGISMSEAISQQHAIKYINNETDVAYCTVFPRKEFQRELASATENLAVGLQEFPDQPADSYWDYQALSKTKPGVVGCLLISAKAGTQFTVTYTMHVEYAGTLPGALTQEAPITQNPPHVIHQVAHSVHTRHAHDGKTSPVEHLSDSLYQHGFSGANKGLSRMQQSKSPYVAGAGFAGAEVLKLAGPSIKKGMRQGASKLFKSIF